jgi:hypothetical protein
MIAFMTELYIYNTILTSAFMVLQKTVMDATLNIAKRWNDQTLWPSEADGCAVYGK